MIRLFQVVLLFILFFSVSGCAPVRTEFYRGETKFLYQRATDAYKNGDFATAKEDYTRITKLDPNYGSAYAALGNIALVEKRYDEALSLYNTAIEYNTDLKDKLLSHIFTSRMYQANKPLADCGVVLNDFYIPLLEEDTASIESLLQKELPLDILAKDSLSVAPGKLGEMRQKAVELSQTSEGSIMYKMFLAHLLFYAEEYDQQLIPLLQKIIEKASDPDNLKKAAILLGKTYERSGKLNDAVDAFLAASDLGVSMEEIAPFLARLYNVEEDIFLKKQGQSLEDSEVVLSPKIVSRVESQQTNRIKTDTSKKPKIITINNQGTSSEQIIPF